MTEGLDIKRELRTGSFIGSTKRPGHLSKRQSHVVKPWTPLVVVAFLAGLAGMSSAVAALESASSAPIKHLRTINPHVTAALSDWMTHRQMAAFLPRQYAASANTCLTQMAGTSSMGMSGVNAHLLLSSSEDTLPFNPALVSSPLLCCHSTEIAYLVQATWICICKHREALGPKQIHHDLRDHNFKSRRHQDSMLKRLPHCPLLAKDNFDFPTGGVGIQAAALVVRSSGSSPPFQGSPSQGPLC